MSYDDWKTRSPDDDAVENDDGPEEIDCVYDSLDATRAELQAAQERIARLEHDKTMMLAALYRVEDQLQRWLPWLLPHTRRKLLRTVLHAQGDNIRF